MMRYVSKCTHVLTMCSHDVPHIHAPPPLPHNPPIFVNNQDLTPYITNSLSVFREKHSRTQFFHLPYPPLSHPLPLSMRDNTYNALPTPCPPPPSPQISINTLKEETEVSEAPHFCRRYTSSTQTTTRDHFNAMCRHVF
jgi:hypothetical protein